MVKVEIFLGATEGASPTISFPNCQLYMRRNDPTLLHDLLFGRDKRSFVWDGVKFEFENAAISARFGPAINQREQPVVGPDAIFNLLVNADPRCLSFATNMGLCGLMEIAILRKLS